MDNSASRVSRPIRVFVLDDHELVRRGLADLLSTTTDLRVVGAAGTVAQARRVLDEVVADVALLDARLGDGNGIDVCRYIRSRYPQVRVLILTSYNDEEALLAAIMGGASGYLLKEIGGTALTDAIRAVAQGASLLDPAVTENVLSRLHSPRPGDPRLASLTPRERQILDLIADGFTNREIGERLFLAEKTVKNVISRIFAKLGLQRRTQAAVYAMQTLDWSKRSKSS